ncbi:MAG: hypothetical protein ACI9O2_000681 [Flammeovirgaceae bacterium]|jgi:hypothetical protein
MEWKQTPFLTLYQIPYACPLELFPTKEKIVLRTPLRKIKPRNERLTIQFGRMQTTFCILT